MNETVQNSQQHEDSLLNETMEYTITNTTTEMDELPVLQEDETTSENSNNIQIISKSDEKPKVTPLNKGGVLTVCVIFICEGFQYSFLFPFIGFMIVDFGLVSEKEEAGYYAGLLAGCFSICQFFSSFIFGVIADRFSKKIIVIISMIGGMLTMLLFGFSKYYWMAILARSLCGALNGNVSTAKAFLSEITDASNQSLAFGFLGTAWGLGAILGPVVGSFFSNPATKYPSIFGSFSLFILFPYLLPCIVNSICMIIGLILCIIFMKTPTSSLPTQKEEGTGMAQEGQQQQEENFELQITTETQETEQQKLTTMVYLSRVHVGTWNYIKDFVKMICCKEIIVSIFLYFTVSMVDTMHEELFPLWSFIEIEKGGLSFSTEQIGFVQIGIGIIILFQPLIFPPIANRIGKLNTLRVGYILFLPTLFTPQIYYLLQWGGSFLLWSVGIVIFYVIFRALFGIFCFTSVFILISNAAPRGRNGAVQGFSNSIGCISRTLAPLLAGPMLSFASTQLSMLPYFSYFNIPFLFCSVLVCIALGVSFLISKKLDYPKEEDAKTST